MGRRSQGRDERAAVEGKRKQRCACRSKGWDWWMGLGGTVLNEPGNDRMMTKKKVGGHY